jgi:autotransporter passenger strand-loop-strand repeat protein
MTVLSALWVEEIGEYFPGTFGTLVLDNNGKIVVSSTATTDTPIVNSAAEVLVFSGGTTVNAVVNGDGEEAVGSGGTAGGTIVNSGGFLSVAGGGTVTGATVNPGGTFGIYNGYSLTDYNVNSNTLNVISATATGTVVENGGYVAVFPGGTVNATTLNGGTLALASTATANGAITFEGTNNLLRIRGTTMGQVQTAVISGLAPDADTIWLPDESYDSKGTATLQSNNLLQISENSSTFSLQLDPSQNFNGNVFALSPDPNGGTDIRLSSSVSLTLSVADPATSVSATTPSTLQFHVSLSQPAPSDLTFDVTLNPDNSVTGASASKTLPYITAQNHGDIASYTTSFTIRQGQTVPDSGDITVFLQADDQIEPDEQFAIQVAPTTGENVSIKYLHPSPTVADSAVGTIKGTDLTAVSNVNVNLSALGLPAAEQTLLINDFKAAAQRIENALGNTVPKFDIYVSGDPNLGFLADAHPASMSETIKVNGNLVYIPNTLAEHLNSGQDPNGPGTDQTHADILVTLNTNSQIGVPEWFSGNSKVDVTTMLTHELIHGLGLGASSTELPQFQTIWDNFVQRRPGSFSFTGSQAERLNNGKPIPLAEAAPNGEFMTGSGHVGIEGDLMDPYIGVTSAGSFQMFGEKITPLDVAILSDLGYGSTLPKGFNLNSLTASTTPVNTSSEASSAFDTGTSSATSVVSPSGEMTTSSRVSIAVGDPPTSVSARLSNGSHNLGDLMAQFGFGIGSSRSASDATFGRLGEPLRTRVNDAIPDIAALTERFMSAPLVNGGASGLLPSSLTTPEEQKGILAFRHG